MGKRVNGEKEERMRSGFLLSIFPFLHFSFSPFLRRGESA
jgi:hypothetical protein